MAICASAITSLWGGLRDHLMTAAPHSPPLLQSIKCQVDVFVGFFLLIYVFIPCGIPKTGTYKLIIYKLTGKNIQVDTEKKNAFAVENKKQRRNNYPREKKKKKKKRYSTYNEHLGKIFQNLSV